MARNRISRQREFELMVAEDRMRRERILEKEDAMMGHGRHTYNPEAYNTLGPNEEVIEKRRRRKRVTMAAPRPASTGNILMENILLLLLLVGSIYGLYRLSIYILNQA
ncbi:MAG: hypothetical protein IJB31_01400 [Akkermansia sp.]|nr:hypothetical protein [Akkermansia sp.]